jgi:hypothetical protein
MNGLRVATSAKFGILAVPPRGFHEGRETYFVRVAADSALNTFAERARIDNKITTAFLDLK